MNTFLKITQKNFYTLKDDILLIEESSFLSPWSLHSFKEETKRVISHLWALKDRQTLAGYICFWLFGGEIHVMNIAVHPDKRGEGFGSHLLQKAISVGISKKIEKIWLEVRPSNYAARALYRKAGFLEIARRPRYYTDSNEDAIVMALHLLGNQAAKNNSGVRNKSSKNLSVPVGMA